MNKKEIVLFILGLIVIILISAWSPSLDKYSNVPTTSNVLYADDNKYSDFYGRLYIPSVDIDVALYYKCSQSVVNRADSAAIFNWKSYSGEIIADHNNQDFKNLLDVNVDTIGYIELKNGEVINIKCVDILNGHNTGTEITDENYNIVMGKADYLMYTCKNGWRNVRICQWNRYESE